VQSLRCCKGRAAFPLEIIFLTHGAIKAAVNRRVVHVATVPSATRPLDIVSFLLTPQVHRRKIPATFPFLFCSREPERKRSRVVPAGSGSTWSPPESGSGSAGARQNKEGEKRAVFAGMDRAMYQSGVLGSWPLAACRRLRRRTLQQLQCATPQCSAAARPSPPAASSLTR
jgi:hypothetical protein